MFSRAGRLARKPSTSFLDTALPSVLSSAFCCLYLLCHLDHARTRRPKRSQSRNSISRIYLLFRFQYSQPHKCASVVHESAPSSGYDPLARPATALRYTFAHFVQRLEWSLCLICDHLVLYLYDVSLRCARGAQVSVKAIPECLLPGLLERLLRMASLELKGS